MPRKLNDVLKEGREILIKNNIEPREARLLLAYSMGISLNDLIKNEDCSNEEYSLFINSIERRANGEPYAYIIGEKEFMKLKFKVNEHTLIPREDTEILVQKALDVAEHCVLHNTEYKILDMCTGSGCIAISLAKYIPNAVVDAVDISEEALKVAKQNAETNDIKVNFIQSDLFENVEEKYDLIVSNPPYIVSNEIDELQSEVRKEPRLALDGGNDGLEFYRKISKMAKTYLKDNGKILFEIGFSQGQAVSNILKEHGYTDVEIIKDLNGNNRVIYAILNKHEE